jgi:hypothetical protein
MERMGDGPQRPPAAYACVLATDRFWRDPERRLIATHPFFDDGAHLLAADQPVAHALVLVLSRLPEDARRPFADAFYELRPEGAGHRWYTSSEPLALGAAAALLVVELAAPPLRAPAIVDLLEGAAQGDDLTRTPEPALEELRKAVAHVRFDVDLADPESASGAASLAAVEVLDPASEPLALQEIAARAAWAAVESWERPRVLAFLLELDRIWLDPA